MVTYMNEILIDHEFKFHKGDIIVVGCSTGPDSMALMDMLLKIRLKYDLSLICAHVNHNIRKESYDEAIFMQEYCKKNDICFETMLIEHYGDDNFHNEARNIRYSFFEKIVAKYNANYLMTAHHGDDLIETILMRIVRGSNLNGYSGFKKIVDMGTYHLVRPLISFTKDELLEYDNLNNVPYFIDSSNSKMKYTRNRYRKVVLPFLKEEDKNVHKKFYKFSENLICASEFIEKSIRAYQWYAPACFNMYRRDFLLQNELFFKVGIYFEDMQMLPRVFLAAQKIACMDGVFYHYVVRENSIMTSQKDTKKKNNSIQNLREWKEQFDHVQDAELRKILYGMLVKCYLHECRVYGITKWEIDGVDFKFVVNNSLNFKEKIKGLLFALLPKCYVRV